MIRLEATSLSGSRHVITGRVRNGVASPYQSRDEAREHLARIGWSDIRFAVDEAEYKS